MTQRQRQWVESRLAPRPQLLLRVRGAGLPTHQSSPGSPALHLRRLSRGQEARTPLLRSSQVPPEKAWRREASRLRRLLSLLLSLLLSPQV